LKLVEKGNGKICLSFIQSSAGIKRDKLEENSQDIDARRWRLTDKSTDRLDRNKSQVNHKPISKRTLIAKQPLQNFPVPFVCKKASLFY
jgi:hypothetical protein